MGVDGGRSPRRRRWQELREQRRRGIYLLPSLLTTGNLFCGFYAIIRAAESRYTEGINALALYVRGLGHALATSKPFTQQHDGLPHLAAAWAALLAKAHVDLYRDDLRAQPLRPWETDDVFYRAQGYAHVLANCTRALQREYAQRLVTEPDLAALVERAAVTLHEAATMKPLVVLDGGPESPFASHRRNLDAALADARQTLEAIRDKLTPP